ncbi:hypothetical protein [Burkholderia sp. Ac-20379]|uniref:hypothetical protein n=1 Tax=Burkholderia sp. Ac-20379 TaxID=2703900 RepID=UPI00198159D4|nr:hypothetical protein [Burkholderia sp. Ac-20379]MBN3726067.1 hypothetical protein [Burkholderia sp. Ac-20379]
MSAQEKNLDKLRNVINENLRTQIGNDKVNYISTGHTLSDVTAKQSHCIFARRGCGKTLLLHHSRRQLDNETRAIYINCEDFKHHSFPNVLIELLDATFRELDRNLLGWFGKSKKLKTILTDVRASLADLHQAPDQQSIEVKAASSEHAEHKNTGSVKAGAKAHSSEVSISAGSDRLFKSSSDIERKYVHNENKLQQLNHNLPSYKNEIRDFFSISKKLRSVYIQIDDFYHLNRADQPFVADYIHRLCKDTPLKFKIATLRHNSVMYIERAGQPIGIQERHDYQPVNIDFTFEHFDRTLSQNRGIFLEYCKLAGMTPADFDALFKGKGFDRLVLAGGGVPRDCMSFFLEVLDRVRTADPAGKIGKDDVRFLSKETFERRIDELKQDSEGQDQDTLLKGIYALRSFCLEKKSSVFLVAENEIQSDDDLKLLLYRLMDYRIIHRVASSLTHKSKTGSNYQAFAIDIGCYAYMRNLQKRLVEIDLTEATAKEKMRSSPIFEGEDLRRIWLNSDGKTGAAALAEQDQTDNEVVLGENVG